ncbi:hypothetical protein LEP1GSC083_2394 [Leptospira interrogans serovar Pyrogenes str. L0374]|uniref:Uncharacterized protein n=1 Tax=Leptospira interrogans serovar Pyrogenes str. L0374 TaxID=1049928 RepID=M6KPC6_LEPIR|nr:hypothetical protein LEP1GSC083_2394 [Leptospira interrogans serovar Pyrogenes str. L0374]
MQVLFKEVIFSVCCSIDPDSSWNFFCFFDPAFEVISFYRKIQSFSFKIDSDYFFVWELPLCIFVIFLENVGATASLLFQWIHNSLLKTCGNYYSIYFS